MREHVSNHAPYAAHRLSEIRRIPIVRIQGSGAGFCSGAIWKFKRCTGPGIDALLSTASLAGAAFRANAAGASANYFVATADGTGDAHEDAAKRYRYAVRVFAAVPVRFSGRPAVRAIGWTTRDHVDHFLFASARQIRYRPVQSFLFYLSNFFERQIRLGSIGRSRLLVAFNKLARQPAKYVIGNTGRVTNIGIFCEPARFKPLIGEFFHEALERHAILQRDRGKRAHSVH
jgi:hypothetical protein